MKPNFPRTVKRTYRDGHPRYCKQCKRQVNVIGRRGAETFIEHQTADGIRCQNSGQPLEQ